MKKVTIITPPEYEGMILESLGRARITQLKHITGSEFDGLEVSEEQSVDYKELYERVQTRLVAPIGLDGMNVEQVTPSPEELKEFARDPYAVIDSLVTESNRNLDAIRASRENVHVANNKLVSELQEKLQVIEDEKATEYEKRLSVKTKLDSISALEPEELKNCFAAGVVKTDFIPNMNEYLTRYPNTYSRVSELSKDESLLFVFGNEESKKWIDALFLVYDIKDIYDVLDPADVLLVLDESKRREAINKYRKKLAELNVQSADESAIDGDYEKQISDLKGEYNSKIEANENEHKEYLENLISEQKGSFGIIRYYANILWVLSRKSSTVLRGKVISIIQGYVQEKKVELLREIVQEAEVKIGERVFVEFSELDADDKHAPVPEKDFGSEAMQPLWILTRLRGWPAANEFNPGILAVVIFCFQFGLMFGDIGQGLVFLALGLALNGKYKEGMMKYLFALFIPMGIAAIVFGFAYDSIFLYEHEITHWLVHSLHWVGNFDSHHHLLNVNTPFGFIYPIMPNPMKETGKLMNLIFQIGAIELILGSLLGAYNAFKAKNYAGMIGEHGFGMGLYVLGLYLSAATMFTEGLDIMAVVGAYPFQLMLLGMGLSFIEPMVHSLMHGHGIGGMESIGQGIGGLLLTFVEGLANMFSFLRVAAFAIAHVSLSGAGETMGQAINSPVAGMVIMNVIAMSFEFIASSVQSIRLLYYEFMGKFFHGEGMRFKPFKINPPKPISE